MKRFIGAVLTSVFLMTTLAGCIVVPVDGPGGYYHHHERDYR
jgi:hypothetical protein